MSVVTLNSLLEDCKGLAIHERRVDKENYKEIVVYGADMLEWLRFFEGRLGPAEKPLNVEPTDEQLRLTEKYGGIRKDQVFLKGKEGAGRVLVMFWPWQDKQYVTLKMALGPSL